MPKLHAINQPLPLAKMAYEILRTSILNGDLRPAEICNEMTLAKELGISRTPVREALLELSTQGLVVFLPRRGVMVKHHSRQDVEEIFELREAIELTAIEKVTRKLSAGDIARIEKELEQQRKDAKKNDYAAFMKADRAFHTLFCELTNNRRFVEILKNIRDLVHFMGRQGLTVDGRAEDVITEHEAVLAAVKQGNVIKARNTMARHLEASKKAVLKSLTLEVNGP